MATIRLSAAALLAASTLMSQTIPGRESLEKMTARFAPVQLKADLSALSANDRKALALVVRAARLMDGIYLDQVWSGNRAMLAKLRADRTPLGQARLRYFLLNKGPWSALDANAPFIPGVPERPHGAAFYPDNMGKAEFDAWVAKLPARQQEAARGYFTVIGRDPAGKLTAVPYSQAYAKPLAEAARLMNEAAALTGNESLRRFLKLRAEAFLHDDYYASDVAWMDLDAPIEPTIGPYETYTDELFGYKAAFEAFIGLRDDAETAKLRAFSSVMQEIENNLPIEARFKNPKLGALAPISVVNEIISTGDAAHGVRTAAFNLPNDERVIREKGSKRVMIKNVQEAKFRLILEPIARRVMSPRALADLSFDAFFTHILAHEMTHGIGPHQIARGTTSTTPRKELKELYSSIEEAKADVTGLFMLQHLIDTKALPGKAIAEAQLYNTFLASAFRTLRFGLNEAHGKGMAIQIGYLMEQGAIVAGDDANFHVDPARIKTAVRNLTAELLTIEAAGDYQKARQLLEKSLKLPRKFQMALDRLKDLPTDISPEFATAESLR